MTIPTGIRRRLAAPLALAMLLALPPGAGHGQGADTPTRATPAKATPTRATYVPPQRGAPTVRISGSTRGPAGQDLTVEALAPDHVGLSATDQPVLYWFVSRPVAAPLEVTVDAVDLTAADGPLLETTRPGGTAAGVASLALGEAGVRLKPGITYEWSVAAVADPRQRSKDAVASGQIRYQPPPPELTAALKRATEAERPALYAAHGYWYDALTAASRTGDRQVRADLLEQVGLAGPAAFERGADQDSRATSRK